MMGLRCGWKGTDRDTRGRAGWIEEMDANDLIVPKAKVGWKGWFSQKGTVNSSSEPRFLSVHGVILDFFRFSRHRMSSENYRWLRARAFKDWNSASAA